MPVGFTYTRIIIKSAIDSLYIPSPNIRLEYQLHEINIQMKFIKIRMDPPGFEPGASALQGRRSPRLSYGPI